MPKRKDSKGRILKTGESQRADGTYMFRYSAKNGQRKTIYSPRLVSTDKTPPGKAYDISLREKEVKILKDLEDGIDSQLGTVTLSDQILKYLNTKPDLARSTFSNYQFYLKNCIIDTPLGNTEISKIKKSNIKTFYSDLIKRGYALGTVKILHKLIHPSLQMAVDDDVIRKNPSQGIIGSFKDDAKNVEALTNRQQELFFDLVKNHPRNKYYTNLIGFLLCTGCRISETVGLTWEDVDFKNRIISIDHQIINRVIDNQSVYYASVPKTKAGIRKIPMSNECYAFLMDERKNSLSRLHKEDNNVDGYHNFVFVTKRTGSCINSNNLNRMLRIMVKNYNCSETQKAYIDKRTPELLPHISAHVLRHTACTRMAEQGMSPSALQYIMGHSSIKMTMEIYTSIDQTKVKEEMMKIKMVNNS